MLLFATLPDAGYIIAACIAVALMALVGVGVILSFGRKLVADLAKVVKNEMSSQQAAAPVAVQQPLAVSAHDPFVPLSQHTALRIEFNTLAEQRRKDISGLHTKIEQGLLGVRDDIAAEFKEVRETQVNAREEIATLKNEASNHTRQLLQLDDKIEDLPQKIIAIIDRK